MNYQALDRLPPNSKLWLLTVAVLASAGCGEAAPTPKHDVNQMVYFDRGTKKAVVYNSATEVPEIHPRTGKPTLVPAMYCEQCKTWFPSPPIEVLQRNPKAVKCSKGHPLTLDGPWPDEVL